MAPGGEIETGPQTHLSQRRLACARHRPRIARRIAGRVARLRGGTGAIPRQLRVIHGGRRLAPAGRYAEAIHIWSGRRPGHLESRIAYYLGLPTTASDPAKARLAYETAARMPSWRAAASLKLGELLAREAIRGRAPRYSHAARSDLRAAEEWRRWSAPWVARQKSPIPRVGLGDLARARRGGATRRRPPRPDAHRRGRRRGRREPLLRSHLQLLRPTPAFRSSPGRRSGRPGSGRACATSPSATPPAAAAAGVARGAARSGPSRSRKAPGGKARVTGGSLDVTFDEELCRGCGLCATGCPDEAIAMAG